MEGGEIVSVSADENIIYDGRIRMPYKWAAGKTSSYFLAQLRDHARLWGSSCPECKMTFMPPRKNCPRCVTVDTTWVELPPRGVLQTYTVVHFSEPALQPKEPPYIYGIVKLDGADTGLTHFLGEVEPGKLRSGMRMEAVFKTREERQAMITDLLYFRPEGGQEA